MEKRVLVGVPNFASDCPDALQLLLKNGFSVDMNPYQRTFHIEELRPIIDRYIAMISELEPWTTELFSLAHNMKIISRNGVGLDNIDLEAARKYKVCVTYAKGVNAASVSNMAIGLMLAVLKKIVYSDRNIRQGKWNSVWNNDLDGKTVGFLGFGQIARETAKHLSGFPVNMIAFDKYQEETQFEGTHVKKTNFETLIKESDIISIHLPSTSETYHLINRGIFQMMRPDAILINTARGGLVDTTALYEALSNHRIAGAGIDVYEEEPVNPNNKLLTLENVVCTPHVSGYTSAACQKAGEQAAQNIVSFFEGTLPASAVPNGKY